MTEIDPKLSRLYREVSSDAPPAVVDAAILAAARQQVAKPERHTRSSWVRWMAPASAIATLALGVSIALLVEREQPGRIDEQAVRPAPPQPQSVPPARAMESTKTKAADSATPEATAKKESPATSASTPVQAPVPASPAQAPALAAPAPPAAQALPAESRAKAAESRMSAPKAAIEANVASDSVLGAAGAAAPAATAGKLAPLRQQEAVQRSPEAWLEAINSLKREGREKEAAEQLAEFRKTFPGYAVPEALLK